MTAAAGPRGRPVLIWLDAGELAAIDQAAKRFGLDRTGLMRRAFVPLAERMITADDGAVLGIEILNRPWATP